MTMDIKRGKATVILEEKLLSVYIYSRDQKVLNQPQNASNSSSLKSMATL